MHDVDGGVAFAQGEFDRTLKRRFDVLVGQRDRARCIGDKLDLAAGVLMQGRGPQLS